jgi:hypothetical protein
MYAHVASGSTAPAMRPELERLIREQLLPALREEDGFCGALHLVNSDTDHTIMVVCWETEEQARCPQSEYRASSVAAPRAIAAIATEFLGRSSVWEIDARASDPVAAAAARI